MVPTVFVRHLRGGRLRGWGAFAESGAPNGNPWTSAAWAWVGGAWHLAALSPEFEIERSAMDVVGVRA